MKPVFIPVGIFWLFLAAQAVAHSAPEVTSPADQSVVATLETITIRFDNPMRITSFVLTGPDGAIDVVLPEGFDPVTEYRAAPAGDPAPGNYKVDWRGLSSDGHPMQGSFGFSLEK